MLCHGEPRTGTVPFPASNLLLPHRSQTKIRRNFGIAKNLRLEGGTWFRSEPVPEGGVPLEELLQRKHLHSALKFSFLGKNPNLGQKPNFLRPPQGVPVTVFDKSEMLLWVFLPAEPIFEKKKASSRPQ
jgi:hypothetical protein